MAHLWLKHPEDPDAWAVVELDPTRDRYSIADDPMPIKRRRPNRRQVPQVVRDTGREDAWALLAPPTTRVAVNGVAVHTIGIHVLRDRDELLVGGETRLFFSTERLPRVEPYPGGEADAFCPLCKKPIDAGKPAVRCPNCGVWHHQGEGRECWTYGDKCVLCECATDMDAGYTWTPQAL